MRGAAMVPIYEQAAGKGIGHSFQSFDQRFFYICKSQRTHKFAMIFYDFRDDALRKILKDQGVFAQLDRLSGESLTIFYLHGGGSITQRFNSTFTDLLGVSEATIPCIVFFNWVGHAFSAPTVVPLESADLIHGFHEIYEIIKEYKEPRLFDRPVFNYLRWVQGSAKFIALESLRAALKVALERVSGHWL